MHEKLLFCFVAVERKHQLVVDLHYTAEREGESNREREELWSIHERFHNLDGLCILRSSHHLLNIHCEIQNRVVLYSGHFRNAFSFFPFVFSL
jgi:hypothetical protein